MVGNQFLVTQTLEGLTAMKKDKFHVFSEILMLSYAITVETSIDLPHYFALDDFFLSVIIKEGA